MQTIAHNVASLDPTEHGRFVVETFNPELIPVTEFPNGGGAVTMPAIRFDGDELRNMVEFWEKAAAREPLITREQAPWHKSPRFTAMWRIQPKLYLRAVFDPHSIYSRGGGGLVITVRDVASHYSAPTYFLGEPFQLPLGASRHLLLCAPLGLCTIALT